MRTATVALACLALLTGSTVGQDFQDSEDTVALLVRIFGDPPATGIVITMVAPESQAALAGVVVGDIFVSYNGVATPDIPSLSAAKETVDEEQTEVEVDVVGPGGKRTITLAPGMIGVSGSPVVKGVAGGGLPADTGVTFDFSRFAGGGVDEWFAFSLDGETKVGFEHARIKVAGGRIFLRREVAFDGGEEWGLNHFDVTVVATLSPAVDAVMTRFENPLTAWVGSGRLSRDAAGRRIWVKKWPEMEEERAEMPGPVVPAYLIETLASLMPHEEGACFRFRPINEGMGTIGLPNALVVRGREEIEFGTGQVMTWRVDGVVLGGDVAGSYWVSEEGQTLRVSYGGAFGTRSTKEVVLSDLHPDLKPRSAE